MIEVARVWHDVEFGSYAADLPLWEELARDAAGPVLELGCGTGRVGLHLARRGQEVVGLDWDEGLVAAFHERGAGLPARAIAGDARDFDLETEFGLVLAPMQLLQLLEGAAEREACLAHVAAHLRPGGTVALAIVEAMPAPVDEPPPVPDAREVDGWVYSSLPIEARVADGEILVRRLRQTVAPDGKLSEAVDEVRLRELDAATLEREATRAGLRPAGRRRVSPTPEHVGSIVVLLRRDA